MASGSHGEGAGLAAVLVELGFVLFYGGAELRAPARDAGEVGRDSVHRILVATIFCNAKLTLKAKPAHRLSFIRF
jgi:hypothetical protein